MEKGGERDRERGENWKRWRKNTRESERGARRKLKKREKEANSGIKKEREQRR